MQFAGLRVARESKSMLGAVRLRLSFSIFPFSITRIKKKGE
jgi:hypothetical protein